LWYGESIYLWGMGDMKAEPSNLTPSPALAVVDVFWTGYRAQRWVSYWRLNEHLAALVSQLIKAGLSFREDDFRLLVEKYDGEHWLRPKLVESLYSLAVHQLNRSAIRAIEKYLGRKPFFCTLEEQLWRHGNRISVNDSFYDKDGNEVRCTSINDRKGYLVGCVYREECADWSDPEAPIEIRYLGRVKITHAGWGQYRRERNAAYRAMMHQIESVLREVGVWATRRNRESMLYLPESEIRSRAFSMNESEEE